MCRYAGTLTQKQMWQKQSIRRPNGLPSNGATEGEDIIPIKTNENGKELAEEDILALLCGDSPSTEEVVVEPPKKEKKTVRFDRKALVVLIPTSKEYHDAGLAPLMWWTNVDFRSFALSVAEEIKSIFGFVPAASKHSKTIMKVYINNLLAACDAKEVHKADGSESPTSVAAPVIQHEIAVSI